MTNPGNSMFKISFCRGGQLTPFFVVGDADYVIAQMLETSESLKEIGMTADQIKIEPRDDVHLDPGGMLMMEEIKEFKVDGVTFSIRPHKLPGIRILLERAKERVKGYLRMPQGPNSAPYFIFIPIEMKEKLDCQLVSLEFVPGTKESRDKADAAREKLFLEGLLARPAEGGGHYVVRKAEQQPPEEDLGFTIPEGIDPN